MAKEPEITAVKAIELKLFRLGQTGAISFNTSLVCWFKEQFQASYDPPWQ